VSITVCQVQLSTVETGQHFLECQVQLSTVETNPYFLKCQVQLSTVESAKLNGLLVRPVQLSTLGTSSPRGSVGRSFGRKREKRRGKEGEVEGRSLWPRGLPQRSRRQEEPYRDRPWPRRGKRRTIVDKSYTKMISL